MIFDPESLKSLPVEKAPAVLEVFRRFTEFNDACLKEENADTANLIRLRSYPVEVYGDYIRAHTFLQAFARKHNLDLNISSAPLSRSDLMDQEAFVDRVRDAYASLEAIYYECLAQVSREDFEGTLSPENQSNKPE
jgi:hypothetical protein